MRSLRCLLFLLPFLSLSVSLSAFLPAFAAGLNDTGIDLCSNGTTSVAHCAVVFDSGGAHAQQDARYGRDAAAAVGLLPKVGGGEAGFDYTALDASGQPTIAGSAANPHPCVRDNVSGLVWEVKTDDGGLRDQQWTYTWYDSAHDYAGNAGTASGGVCLSGGRCDSEKYVADVNASALCAFTDWRLPSGEELESLIHYGRIIPSIDPVYFPHTPSWMFWSSRPFAPNPGSAWVVVFSNGDTAADRQSNGNHVRLVRGEK